MDKVIIDGVDVSGCEHYRAEIETKMPYGEYEIQKDKCHYSGIEIIQDCKGNKGCIYKQLQRAKAELKKYEDMAKKGLEEFKDIGGCWGCGIQLSLNQAWEDLKEYREKYENVLKLAKENADSNEYCLKELEQENERLKEELRTEKIYSSQIEELEGSLQHAKAENEELSESIKRLKNMAKAAALGREKYKQALQEIREIANIIYNTNCNYVAESHKIIDKINEVIGAE